MPAPTNERLALEREQAALPAQTTEAEATLPLRANRADQAGLVVQDVARSSLRKPVHGAACIQCRRVILTASSAQPGTALLALASEEAYDVGARAGLVVPVPGIDGGPPWGVTGLPGSMQRRS